MSGRYTPVQNVEAFSAFDPLVRDGLLTYETAGELHGGIVWVLAKADGTMLKDVDPIHKYLLLVNSFDGSTALRVRFTPIRVVCQNTLSMALGRPQAEAYSLRHMASVKLRMQEAFAALRMALSRFDEAEQQFQRMMERIINEEERTWYYHQVVPGDSKQADETRRILAHVATRDTQAATDSLWAAYNSVTWHIDHRACGKDRLKASWFGQGASMRQRATSAALELCERR
jgi:phage/plasmid-like protein (TIGR03299 family)